MCVVKDSKLTVISGHVILHAEEGQEPSPSRKPKAQSPKPKAQSPKPVIRPYATLLPPEEAS